MATKKKPTAMTNVAKEMQKELAEIQNRIAAPSGNRISAKDKTFKVPGEGEAPDLEVIIVAFAARNDFYVGKYNPKSIVPPKCAAAGLKGTHDNLVPFETTPKPEAESCEVCPNNQWGSDGRGKACKNTYLLAVLSVNEDKQEKIFTLSLPPTSLPAFSDYVNSLSNLEKLPVMVKTLITFDQDSDFTKFEFKLSGPNASAEEHFGRSTEANKLITQAPDFSARKAA